MLKNTLKFRNRWAANIGTFCGGLVSGIVYW